MNRCVVGLMLWAMPWLLWAQDATKPLHTGAEPAYAGSIVKLTFGLGLVLAAIFASAWFIRRFGNITPRGGVAMRIVGGLAVGPKEKVMLVQVGEVQLLVGVAPGRVQTLHVLDRPITDESAIETPHENFAARLGAAVKQWKPQ